MSTGRSGQSVLFATVGLLIMAALAFGKPLNIVQVSTSPNGLWTVELSDWLKPSQIELRSQPSSPAWRKVGGPLKADYDVSAFVISADSTRVVYREGRTALGDWALFSAPIHGGAGLRISQSAVTGSSVEPGFHLISDARVRFRWTPDGSAAKWYVVPVNGGRILEEIFADGFESGGRAKWTQGQG